ncbi:hypothetical protein D9M69_571510 [compost metagenome]
MDQHIIGGNAGLTRIEVFACRDRAGCTFKVAVLADDRWRFSTQFQGYGCEVFCSCFHDLAAHSRRPCEEQMIEGQGGKLC